MKKYAFPDRNIFAKPSCCPFLQKGKVKPVHIVDVPGHARLKPKLDEVMPLQQNIDIITHFCNTFIIVLQRSLIVTQNYVLLMML